MADPRGESNSYGGYANKSTGAGGYNNKSGGGGRDANDRGNGEGAARYAAQQEAARVALGQQQEAARQAQQEAARQQANEAARVALAQKQAAQAQARMAAAYNPQEQNTYANAPTQFTEGRSGTSYYPAQAPDTMFRGLGNGITGGFKGKLLDKLGNAIGPEGYVGGMLNAYNQFDPLGDFAQQTVYGMNDIARDEYLRQEASNPNWQMMSEKERVQLARKPQMGDRSISKPNNFSDQQWEGMTQGQKLYMSGVATSTNGVQDMGGSGGAFAGQAGNGNGNGGAFGGGYNNESGIGASVSGNNGQYFNGGYTGDAVNQLSQARSPRGMEFGNIYGTTQFDPLTGQFTEQAAPEYQQFQQGLLGQLQGSQDAYQSFDPQDAASEYLRGVNAIREPLREQQTQSALSRLIQSGKLGATAGTQALAQLETEQENQRFQEGVQATQYGEAAQDRMLRNQAGMFGLTQNVADQQFKPQQQALGSVPMLQQIYGFAQEPQFQQGLAEQGIAAQQSANNTSNWMNLGTSVLGSDVGQDLISDAWGWLTNS